MDADFQDIHDATQFFRGQVDVSVDESIYAGLGHVLPHLLRQPVFRPAQEGHLVYDGLSEICH